MAPDDDDPKVKKLLGQTTQADLERWFTLPSFQQVADDEAAAAAEPTDEELAAVADRKARTAAAVDLTLVDAIHRRTDENPRVEGLIQFRAELDVHEHDVGVIDEVLVAKASAFAEPRIYEVYDFEDELSECTPQALLRDLHRPELYFDKQFEVVDPAEEDRVDVVAEVQAAMKTRWKVPELDNHVAKARALWNELRAACGQHPMSYLPALPNRRLQE